MLSDVVEFVVQGSTLEGEIFEPADWAERLRDTLPAVGSGGSMDCSAYVRLVKSAGDVFLVVRISLKEANPQAFELIKKYISDHGLMVRSGRDSCDVIFYGCGRTFGHIRFLKVVTEALLRGLPSCPARGGCHSI